MVAGGIAILRGLFPNWNAYRIAEETLGASVPRSDLLWKRALDVGSQTWDTRYFTAFFAMPILRTGLWVVDGIAISKDKSSLYVPDMDRSPTNRGSTAPSRVLVCYHILAG